MNRIFITALIIIVSACTIIPNENCSGVYSLDGMGWYESQMKAAGAKPLCKTVKDQNEAFRFTWLRTFHNPIVVTLEKEGDKVHLDGVRLDGAGGYKPGKIVEKIRTILTVEEYAEFSRLIGQLDFRSLKTQDQLMDEALRVSGELIIGTDGAQWVFEGANFQYAHSVDRWSLDKGPLKEAGLYLLEKSKIKLNGPVY